MMCKEHCESHNYIRSNSKPAKFAYTYTIWSYSVSLSAEIHTVTYPTSKYKYIRVKKTVEATYAAALIDEIEFEI